MIKMKSFKTAHLKNSGMTLIEVMVSIAISSIVILASLSIGNMSTQQQSQNNISFQADIVRRNMIALITSDTAWGYTINNNSSMSCLNDTGPPGCPGGSNTNVSIASIRDAKGNEAYNVGPYQGFNVDGSACSGSATHPCAIVFDVKWSSLCTGGPACVHPQVKVNITPTFNLPSSSSGVVLNPLNYSATVYR